MYWPKYNVRQDSSDGWVGACSKICKQSWVQILVKEGFSLSFQANVLTNEPHWIPQFRTILKLESPVFRWTRYSDVRYSDCHCILYYILSVKVVINSMVSSFPISCQAYHFSLFFPCVFFLMAWIGIILRSISHKIKNCIYWHQS